METTETKKSLLNTILDGALEAIKRPFAVKRIERAFASASDSLEEQLTDAQAALLKGREELVISAKEETNLKSKIQSLIDLQVRIIAIKDMQSALSTENKELLG